MGLPAGGRDGGRKGASGDFPGTVTGNGTVSSYFTFEMSS